ncbi:hypothetical protein ACEWY4_006513 [Coilia grayii]|uniref:RIIa domain-containing protein n=1 Tax=Coilia grayii TaxID=363190 RepID=A0ABD1KE64_9TELE
MEKKTLLGKLYIPSGLQPMLEGFSKAVVKCKPESVTHFGEKYFKALHTFRDVKQRTTTPVPGPIRCKSKESWEAGPLLYEARVNQMGSVPLFPAGDSTAKDMESPKGGNGQLFPSEGCKAQIDDSDLDGIISANLVTLSPGPITPEMAMDLAVFRRKTTPKSSPLTSCSSSQSGRCSDRGSPCQRICSALFEQVPLSVINVDVDAVLIRTAELPNVSQIIVQSEEVPEIIVFHADLKLSNSVRDPGCAAMEAVTVAEESSAPPPTIHAHCCSPDNSDVAMAKMSESVELMTCKCAVENPEEHTTAKTEMDSASHRSGSAAPQQSTQSDRAVHLISNKEQAREVKVYASQEHLVPNIAALPDASDNQIIKEVIAYENSPASQKSSLSNIIVPDASSMCKKTTAAEILNNTDSVVTEDIVETNDVQTQSESMEKAVFEKNHVQEIIAPDTSVVAELEVSATDVTANTLPKCPTVDVDMATSSTTPAPETMVQSQENLISGCIIPDTEEMSAEVPFTSHQYEPALAVGKTSITALAVGKTSCSDLPVIGKTSSLALPIEKTSSTALPLGKTSSTALAVSNTSSFALPIENTIRTALAVGKTSSSALPIENTSSTALPASWAGKTSSTTLPVCKTSNTVLPVCTSSTDLTVRKTGSTTLPAHKTSSTTLPVIGKTSNSALPIEKTSSTTLPVGETSISTLSFVDNTSRTTLPVVGKSSSFALPIKKISSPTLLACKTSSSSNLVSSPGEGQEKAKVPVPANIPHSMDTEKTGVEAIPITEMLNPTVSVCESSTASVDVRAPYLVYLPLPPTLTQTSADGEEITSSPYVCIPVATGELPRSPSLASATAPQVSTTGCFPGTFVPLVDFQKTLGSTPPSKSGSQELIGAPKAWQPFTHHPDASPVAGEGTGPAAHTSPSQQQQQQQQQQPGPTIMNNTNQNNMSCYDCAKLHSSSTSQPAAATVCPCVSSSSHWRLCHLTHPTAQVAAPLLCPYQTSPSMSQCGLPHISKIPMYQDCGLYCSCNHMLHTRASCSGGHLHHGAEPTCSGHNLAPCTPRQGCSSEHVCGHHGLPAIDHRCSRCCQLVCSPLQSRRSSLIMCDVNKEGLGNQCGPYGSTCNLTKPTPVPICCSHQGLATGMCHGHTPSKMLKPRLTVIIPYGLKNMLKAISHAVLVEQPSNVAEYMSAYCNELLCLREEHPELSIQDLTTLIKFTKRMYEIQISSCAFQETFLIFWVESENSLAHLASREADQPDDGSEKGNHSPHSIEVEEVEDEDSTTSPVQSAVFLRTEKQVSNASLVLIETLRPPSKPMIIIHSDNLPEVIMFHNNEQQPAPSSTPSSQEVLEMGSEQSGTQMSVCSDVVVFQKVPSVQDLAHSLNLLDELEELKEQAYTVEELDSSLHKGYASALSTKQPSLVPEVVVNDTFLLGDGPSENNACENTGHEKCNLQLQSGTTLEGSFAAMSSDDTGAVKHVTLSSIPDTSCPSESYVTSNTGEGMNTIHFIASHKMTGGPRLKQEEVPKTEASIKLAIAERDRLMKKILQSTQLKTQTVIAKTNITGITVSSNIGGYPAHLQKILEPNAGDAKAGQTPVESKVINSNMDPALQNPVDQIWTLYQMTGETEAKESCSNPSLLQPDNHVSTQHNDQKAISENYSLPESSPSQKEREQSPKPSGLSGVQLINTPNYVLVNDDDTERKGNQASDSPPCVVEERQRSGMSRNWMTQFLSISFPLDPLCSDPAGSRPLFFGVPSDQGNVACSPVFIREINPTTAVSHDTDGGSDGTSSSVTSMQWSIEISFKK